MLRRRSAIVRVDVTVSRPKLQQVLSSSTRNYHRILHKSPKPKPNTRIPNRGNRYSRMAIAGDFRVSAALGPSPTNPLRISLPPKVDQVNFLNKGSTFSESTMPKWTTSITHKINHTRIHSKRPLFINDYEMSTSSINQDAETFLLNAINMSFFERLSLAFKIIFPSPTLIKNSNASVAKQRLKMILFSDRCAVSEEAKQKIVSNIVRTLSDFVVIESQDKVQLSVATDPALGTIYSVTVPVRRVKAEYQEEDGEGGTIMNVEYKDNGVESGSMDVKFDFYVPE